VLFRGLLVSAVILAGVTGAAGPASADGGTVPVQYLNATGTVTPPTDAVYTGTSSGTSPVHVTLKVTQATAFGFDIQSFVTDDTPDATISSNAPATNGPDGALNGAIAWTDANEETGQYTGTFAYAGSGTHEVTDVVTDSNGATATAQVQVTTLGSEFSPVTPTRVLDTRNGTGAAEGKVGKGAVVKLHVAGAANIPETGVVAVVMNLTVTNASGAGFVTVYPSTDGSTVPNVSNLNYGPGQNTVANLVTVPVGTDGYIYLANAGSTAGPIDLVADVSGYYTHSNADEFETASPERLLDTRNGTGAPEGKIPAGGTVKLLAALGNTNLPPVGYISAIAVNITVTDPNGNGFITAYADRSSKPDASNLNYGTGQTIANNAVVPVGADGEIDLTNTMSGSGSTDLVVDVLGYYSSNPDFATAAYIPVAPSRVFDSRLDGAGQIQTGVNYELALGDWASTASGLVLNATVTDGTSNGFISLFGAGTPIPATSNINWGKGRTLGNAALVAPTGPKYDISVYSGGANAGGVDLILDVYGYFQTTFTTIPCLDCGA
jgi:hypothetical protein